MAKAKAKAKSQAKKPAKSKSKSSKKPTKKPAKKPGKKKTVLLSGGNPQIAKGEGDAPVKAYLAALPGWKGEIAKRVDAIIVREVPGVKKAVKWNSPFYGVEGRGWFASVHAFTRYVRVTFFRGTSLRPQPPVGSAHEDVRYADLFEAGFDEAQMTSWVSQAAARPGWMA